MKRRPIQRLRRRCHGPARLGQGRQRLRRQLAVDEGILAEVPQHRAAGRPHHPVRYRRDQSPLRRLEVGDIGKRQMRRHGAGDKPGGGEHHCQQWHGEARRWRAVLVCNRRLGGWWGWGGDNPWWGGSVVGGGLNVGPRRGAVTGRPPPRHCATRRTVHPTALRARRGTSALGRAGNRLRAKRPAMTTATIHATRVGSRLKL